MSSFDRIAGKASKLRYPGSKREEAAGYCSKCGTPFLEGDSHCAECGADLPGVCAECGAPIMGKFCVVCGAEAAEAAAKPVGPAKCARCGAELRPGAKCCTHCGARQGGDS